MDTHPTTRNDSSRDDANPTADMFDSAIGMEEGQPPMNEESERSAASLTGVPGRKRLDSGCFAEDTELGYKANRGVASNNTLVGDCHPTRVSYGNIVRNTKEMKEMVNALQDQLKVQEATKSTTLPTKVFCKNNFTMAIVGEAGCRLFFPDGSLTLVIPPGALVKDTVIYVYKPINSGGQHESTEPGNMIHYGPSLLCGTEGTTFNKQVKLSCRHHALFYEKFGPYSKSFAVRKCEKKGRPWKFLEGHNVELHKRTVDVMLHSFSLIEFVGQALASVPRKMMACIFGILLAPDGRKVAHVCLVDGDPTVIEASENDLQNKGCKKGDIYTLRHVQIDPTTDVTFTVLPKNQEHGPDAEGDLGVIKPSSMTQQACTSLDVSSNEKTIGRCIDVRQDGITLGTFNVPDGTFKHTELLAFTPHQADQDFSFQMPAPLPTEKCPIEVRRICRLYGLAVYEGSLGFDAKEEEKAASVGPAPVRPQRRSSVSAAGSPSVPTISEGEGNETQLTSSVTRLNVFEEKHEHIRSRSLSEPTRSRFSSGRILSL